MLEVAKPLVSGTVWGVNARALGTALSALAAYHEKRRGFGATGGRVPNEAGVVVYTTANRELRAGVLTKDGSWRVAVVAPASGWWPASITVGSARLDPMLRLCRSRGVEATTTLDLSPQNNGGLFVALGACRARYLPAHDLSNLTVPEDAKMAGPEPEADPKALAKRFVALQKRLIKSLPHTQRDNCKARAARIEDYAKLRDVRRAIKELPEGDLRTACVADIRRGLEKVLRENHLATVTGPLTGPQRAYRRWRVRTSGALLRFELAAAARWARLDIEQHERDLEGVQPRTRFEAAVLKRLSKARARLERAEQELAALPAATATELAALDREAAA